MAFAQGKKKYDGSMLDNVLPEYEKASKMVYSVTEVPAWHDIRKNFPDRTAAARERDRFEDAWLAKEAAKLYKSIDDESGNVFLIVNPVVWGISKNSNGRCTMIRPVPRMVGHINELTKTAELTGKPVGQVNWGEI